MSEVTTFLPKYDSGSEYNAEILRHCIPMMIKNKVSAHPINYAIWYEYVAGINGKLNEAVDELIENQKAFDDATSLDLYKTYVCNASVETFEKINFDLQSLIDNASMTVEDTSNKVSKVGDNFLGNSLKLEEINDLADVKTVLSDIVAETKQLVEISQTLKSKLNDANNEMDQLRSELTKVKEMATKDALTGLLNRRAFDDALAELVDNVIESSHCLLILDLDHFKKVNDSFGHLVGDKVIRFTAGLLKKNVDDHHHVARYGGEEMAVIMPNTELENALEIAESVREALAKSKLKQKDSGVPIGNITVSIGATSLKIDDSVDSFIARADNALYRAKESGRNKVVHH